MRLVGRRRTRPGPPRASRASAASRALPQPRASGSAAPAAPRLGSASEAPSPRLIRCFSRTVSAGRPGHRSRSDVPVAPPVCCGGVRGVVVRGRAGGRPAGRCGRRLRARARRDRSVGCRCGRGGRCCRAGWSRRTPRARSSRTATGPRVFNRWCRLHNGARLSVAVGPPCSGWSWLYGMTWSRSQCLALRPHHGNTQVPSRTITCSRIPGWAGSPGTPAARGGR